VTSESSVTSSIGACDKYQHPLGTPIAGGSGLWDPITRPPTTRPHAIYSFVQNKAQALLDVNFYLTSAMTKKEK
jgi:hypothetical protein